MTDPSRAELDSQLRTLPAFRALLRSVEAVLLSALGPLPGPVLDLGCGDGDFGARALATGHVIGVDSDLPSLFEARQRGRGRIYCAGSATTMPLATRSVGSIVANSVLEHVEDLDGALRECARVLRPGGQLVVTAPSQHFTTFLLGTRLLRLLRFKRGSDLYGQWFNRHSHHYHLDSLAQWETRLATHGLRLQRGHYYFSARAHAVFDALHYLGIPTLLLRRATGRWLPWRNPLTLRLALRWLSPLASPAPLDEGAYILLVAERES